MCVKKLAQLIRGWFSRVPVPVGEESDSSGVPGLDWFVSDAGSDDTGDGSFDNPWATPSYASSQVTEAGDVTNFDIKNNIINGNFSYPIKFEPRSGSTPTVTNLNVTDNILFGGGTTAINYVAGVTYVGGDHDDADNLEDVDPLFVGGSPYDFHLASTDSPAYHAGVDVGLDTDYDGVAWESVPSIGCYEYV